MKLLEEFISLKSESSFTSKEVITKRVEFLINRIPNLIQDIFYNKRYDKNYINLYYYKDNSAPNTICLLAHHDINNPNSLNVNDNSASIINLISVIENYDLNIDNNILIVFTDAEEIVDLKNNGAWRLGEQIKNGRFGNVQICINLELTAHGNNIWYEHDYDIISDIIKDYNIVKVNTPFNDSYSLRAANIPSVCIGIVEDADILQIKQSGYCDTWSVCHRINDTRYNEDDMKKFTDKLYQFIINI